METRSENPEKLYPVYQLFFMEVYHFIRVVYSTLTLKKVNSRSYLVIRVLRYFYPFCLMQKKRPITTSVKRVLFHFSVFFSSFFSTQIFTNHFPVLVCDIVQCLSFPSANLCQVPFC